MINLKELFAGPGQRQARLIAELDRALAGHRLADSHYWGGPDGDAYGAWRIVSDSGNLDAHVFAGSHGSLTVVGDCSSCCWQYGGGRAVARLRWVGTAGLDYAAQKAQAGGYSPNEFNADQARVDILQLRRDGGLSAVAAREATELLDDWDTARDDLMDTLSRYHCDAWELSPGMRLSTRFLQSMAVVRRCWQLVEAEMGATT